MTEVEKARRRQLSFIVEKLALITNLTSHELYGVAEKMRQLYPVDFILQTLDKIHEGHTIGYCLGTLRREYSKTKDPPNVPPSIKNLTEQFNDEQSSTKFH